MNGNREQHTSETSSGVTKTVDWKLRNWVSSKEVHVTGSWCDVSLPLSHQEPAQVRYGLKWVKQNHVAHASDGYSLGQCVTKYLALTVEPRQLPTGPLLLHVKMSWNLKDSWRNMGHPSTFETCVRVEMGRKVTVFDNVLPDGTWIIGSDWGGHSKTTRGPPTPEGDDLIVCITSTVVRSTSTNCVA